MVIPVSIWYQLWKTKYKPAVAHKFNSVYFTCVKYAPNNQKKLIFDNWDQKKDWGDRKDPAASSS